MWSWHPGGCWLLGLLSWYPILNSLVPGWFQFNIRTVVFKLTLVNGGWDISCEIALRWMPQDLTDDRSTLVQEMAWCRQAASHYLSQCWPRSMSLNGVTRPQWVKSSHCNSDEQTPHRFHLLVPDLEMSCRNLAYMTGYQASISSNGHQVTCPIIIPPAIKLGGVYWIHPVCPSVRLSVR